MEETSTEMSGMLASELAQLTAVAGQLERVAAALEQRLTAMPKDSGGEVAKVVATIEGDSRLTELETKLCAAEAQIAELRAQAAAPATRRQTLPATAAHLLEKHGMGSLEQVNGGALDAALDGLSLEQRIAVKSQLLRAGLIR